MTEERRLVTVLFADVAGSTAMGEALDPEDMRALLARYFAIARGAVEERGGTVEKFIGDAVMAVFGLPTAHGDDAARAATAALDLRDQVRADPGLGERLPIRLGLATGEVVAAIEGGGDFLITGDAVNLAARLQQGAASWEIVVSERTVRAAGTGFSFGPLVEVEARGKGTLVPARRLEGAAAKRAGRRTPFLGRDSDLAQFELTAARVLREQRPYLVTLTAPAGTGKSRLLEEFLERLPMLQANARVVTAQCLPWGQRLTYLPLHALLLALLGLPEDAESDAMRSAAEAWLTAAGDAAPRRTAELLAATFGATEGDPIDRAELFAAWRSTMELAARERPLVMVVEDLHWSSDSLLDLIELVLQPRGAAPMLMIVLARPELLDRRPTWSGGRRNSVSIALEPLDDLAISALVDFHLHGPPPEVVAAVVGRAGGNPFFAGELARSIADRAPDLHDPQAVAAVMSTLPDNVHGAILARLDLLPAAARRIVQLGAIFGRSFRPAGIEVLTPELSAELTGAIDHLLEHDLIRAGSADEYTFRHILIRDVGYQTLPRAERARFHGAAAAWLEAEAVDRGEEQAELIAFHFREAVTLATAAGVELNPALTASAVTWLQRAAQAANAGAALGEAARHLRAAIELAPRNLLPELWADLGDVYGAGGPAIEAYATAARLGAEEGESANFMLRVLGHQLMVLGRWAGSVGSDVSPADLQGLLDQVRAVRATATDRRLIGFSLVAESFVGWISPAGVLVDQPADRAAAQSVAAQAAAIARELDDATLLSMALDAQAALDLGMNPEQSLALTAERASFEDRLPLFERVDLHNMLAWNHAALGNLQQVVPTVEAVLRDLAPNQATVLAMSLSAWHVWGLAMTGRWDEMAAATESFARRWEDSGRPSAGYALHGAMAAIEVGWARGDDRLAARGGAVVQGITEQFSTGSIFRRVAAFAIPDPGAMVSEVIGDWMPYGTRLHLVERCLSLSVDLGQAIPAADLDGLLEMAEARGQRLLTAQVRRARGVQAGAANDLRMALDAFRAFAAPAMVARLEIELGRLTGDAELETSGRAGLESLGDLAALGRYAVATSRR